MNIMKPKSGFTLIELMIVVAIIAIIAAIAIPSLLNARRTSNQTAAAQTLNTFYKAATGFSMSSATNYFWSNGTTDFNPYYHHVTPKAGYNYSYYSNDTDGDADHEASRYIYLAVPVSVSTGRYAYYCSEHHSIYKSALLTQADVDTLNAIGIGDIDFDASIENRINTAIVFAPIS